MAKTTKNTQPKTTKAAASRKAKEGTVIQIEPKKTAKKAKKATAEALELPTLGADGADAAAERNLLLEGIKDKVSLGFCKMNIIKPPPIIEWRTFNDRGLSKSEAVKLKENFVMNGQQVTSPSNVFRLLVEPEWIDTVLTPNIAGKSIKDLNEFKTRSGVSLPSKINACGGNHRRHATSLMEAYWKEKEEIAKDVKSQIYPAEKNVELPVLKNAPAVTS